MARGIPEGPQVKQMNITKDEVYLIVTVLCFVFAVAGFFAGHFFGKD